MASLQEITFSYGENLKIPHHSFYGGTLLVSKPVCTQPLRQHPIGTPPKQCVPIIQLLPTHDRLFPCSINTTNYPKFNTDSGTQICYLQDGRVSYKTSNMKKHEFLTLEKGQILRNTENSLIIVYANGIREYLFNA